MTLKLPVHLKEKASEFPESSYGANQISLILKDNRKIKNVFLAWGNEIVKIGNKEIKSENDLGFYISEVEDIISEI